jgi:hypothetical protein
MEPEASKANWIRPMSVITQPICQPIPLTAEVPTEPIYRLSVDQYHAMIRTGILEEDTPVELLEGWLVQKMTKNPPHTTATQLTREALEGLGITDFFINVQEPITTDTSEPEADVSLIRGRRRDYHDRHPGAEDVALAVEVADSSLHRDRTTKKQIYARNRIPVYWIVNLIESQVEVYRDPSGPTAEPDYRQRQIYRPEDSVPVEVDGREVGRIAVRDLLP